MQSRGNRALVGAWVLMIAALLVIAPMASAAPPPSAEPQIAALAAFSVTGPAVDDIGKPGAWDCGSTWTVGNRWGDTTADSDSLGGALPPGGYVATLTAFTNSGRFYKLILYAPQNTEQGRRGGDLIITMPFENIAREPGYVFPTGRYDPVGKPVLYFTPNQLRFNQAIYRGSGSLADGGRVYTGCGINGLPSGG